MDVAGAGGTRVLRIRAEQIAGSPAADTNLSRPQKRPVLRRAGAGEWRQLTGPLLATAAGGRLRQGHLWELVRRLARTAGIGAWEQLSPHCLRHSAITFALDAWRLPARRARLRRP